jgi:hypothetical protein
MDWLNSLLSNFVVQILIGVGLMVCLIMIGEAVKSIFSNRLSGKSLRKAREEAGKELSGLREEMKAMKDTLLAHSMSLDENVGHLARRVENLERRIESVRAGD